MVAVPGATPTITPEVALMVAMEAGLIDHKPPETVELAVVLKPTQRFVAAEIVPALGKALIMIVFVAVATQPLVVTVDAIVAVPAVTPVMTPEVLFMVAIVVGLIDHTPPVAVELAVVVAPTQRLLAAEIVPALGMALMSIAFVAVPTQPLVVMV